MKKYISIMLAGYMAVSLTACKNDDDNNPPADNLNKIEADVATNFANNIALASYTDLETSAANLNADINTFVTIPTEENLKNCKDAWINLRVLWETSEGYLFGPVEDNEYDPKMDTWPTDYSQMNILLNDSAHHQLDLADIQSLDYTLRGYHPIEYMLWGVNSNKQVSEFTTRQIKYLLSLSLDVKTLCSALRADWTSGYTDSVSNAGKGTAPYATYADFFTTLADGMIGICNEVGHSDENTGKIWEPFNGKDSNIVESPYSENSLTDFKNNVTGAYNVYLGKYQNQGAGLTNVVSYLNKDLDNQIKQKFQNAINAFGTINGSFELAIYNQRPQLQSLIDAIGGVRDILDQQLKPFIVTNIKN